jgi:integrase
MRPLIADEGGGWLITFPDLPGCMSDGETPEEAIENGRDLPWLSRYLGHSSISVTETHYGHFDRSGHTRHIEALEKAFGA